jgi:hypothetical protein
VRRNAIVVLGDGHFPQTVSYLIDALSEKMNVKVLRLKRLQLRLLWGESPATRKKHWYKRFPHCSILLLAIIMLTLFFGVLFVHLCLFARRQIS